MMRLQFCFILSSLILTEYASAGSVHPKGGMRSFLKREPACHIISVGINNYELNQTGLAFGNSVNDARYFSESVREAYWQRKLPDLMQIVLPRRKNKYSKEVLKNWNRYPHAVDSQDSLVRLSLIDSLRFISRKDSILSKWFIGHTLLNGRATKDNIVNAFKEVIQQAGPDDTFVFDFSGYTVSSMDANGNPETFFIPHTIAILTDTTQLLKDGISLRAIREMLEFVKAKNQLVVIEASYSEQFSEELTQLLVENDPRKSEVLGRDRIIIAPSKWGEDRTYCQDSVYQNGPLHHLLLSLRKTSVFDLFTAEKKKDVVMEIWRQEMDCGLRGIPSSSTLFYTQFIFERDLIGAASRKSQKAKTRGGVVSDDKTQTSSLSSVEKHDLLIGTDHYKSADALKTPLNDVRAIAKQLSENYGYTTNVLENKSKDSVMAQLVRYAQSLDSTSQLIIYVAGHGDYDAIFDDGFLVFTDSRPKAQDPYRQSCLFYGQLANLLNKVRAQQILLILDVCFGGTFERRVIESSKYRVLPTDTINIRKAAKFMKEKLHYPTRQVLTSGGKNVVPDFLAGANNSPFNQQIQIVLQQRGGVQGWLTFTNLVAQVQGLDSGPVHNGFGRHHPQGEFLLIPVEPKPRE